jgi:hypothetical protein
MRRRTRLGALTTCLALAAGAVAVPASTGATTTEARSVMFVGNNWAGTASIVEATGQRRVLLRGIDLVPDKAQELADIHADPERLAFYLLIQQGPGEGHDQYVDDMFSTPDGRFLAVSRPSFADVVWVDLEKATTGRPDSIVREQQMDGHRTDHMALSPDGTRLLVSDSTARQVIEYSMVDQVLPDGTRIAMGDRLRTFESGETPHESNYTGDQSRIFHASIGRVYTPVDGTEPLDALLEPVTDAVKGDRWFQVVRNSDFRVTERWDMGAELAEAGHPGMSGAVRPMALHPDERFLYFQVSFFHGIVEFDTRATDANGQVDYTLGGLPEPRTGRVTRLIRLPKRTTALREQYVNDSAHHGLAIDRTGTTLCAAGTMDDYVALVDRATGQRTMFDPLTTGRTFGKPYWTTEGPGNTCWVSLSESDAVAVIDFERKRLLAYHPVGDHPQRIRHGYVAESITEQW